MARLLVLEEEGLDHQSGSASEVGELEPGFAACRRPTRCAVAGAAKVLLAVGLLGLAIVKLQISGTSKEPVDAHGLSEKYTYAYDKDWADLTDDQQKIAASAGYTQHSWDHDSSNIDGLYWRDMGTRQHKALRQLGFMEDNWDYDVKDYPLSEPDCPNHAAQLRKAGKGQILARVVQAAGGNPSILVLSCGTRPQGAKTGRLTEGWVKSQGFDMTYGNYAKFDEQPFTSDDARAVIQSFLSKRAGNKGTVIMYSGHGRKGDGAWSCPTAPDGPGVSITPSWVKDTAESAGAPLPIIVTGSCFGGTWLDTFDGVSGSRPDQTNSPKFYDWLMKGGAFPEEHGKYPMCRGLPKPRSPREVD